MRCEYCQEECTCHLNPPCNFCITHLECEICGKMFCFKEKDETLCPDCVSAEEAGKLSFGNEDSVELKQLMDSGEGRYTAHLFRDCVKFFDSTLKEISKIVLDERETRRILCFKEEREIFLETKNCLILRMPFQNPKGDETLRSCSPVFKVNKKNGKTTILTSAAIRMLPRFHPWRSLYKDDLICCSMGELFFDLKDERFFEIPEGYLFDEIKGYSEKCGLVLMEDNEVFNTSKLTKLIFEI